MFAKMCHDKLCYTLSRLINTLNKKVDFDVDFDDEKIRKTKAEQNIAKKDFNINLDCLRRKGKKLFRLFVKFFLLFFLE
jgi:hypothetical protein